LSHDNLTYEDLLRIVELIKASEQFSEFRLKIGDVEVELRRRGAPGIPSPTAAPGAPAPVPATPATEPTPPRQSEPPSRLETSWPEGSVVVRAPMVGTFYRAPEPGARHFVDVGQFVEDHTVVCIIEVMKLMNSIAAGARGMVTHVLVDDAQPVETGQPLIVLQPEMPAP
jgi:acetyl-CoA carboxylase biotin carboxyl carrier protein